MRMNGRYSKQQELIALSRPPKNALIMTGKKKRATGFCAITAEMSVASWQLFIPTDRQMLFNS